MLTDSSIKTQNQNKQIKVLKFGGSSVADFDKIKAIAEYLKSRTLQQEKLVVVVSAMGKTTDQLLNNASTLSKSPKDSALAMLLSTGEQQTIAYLSIILQDISVEAVALTGAQAGIKTEGHHLKSKIQTINTDKINQLFSTKDIIIIAGFQGVNHNDELTTLGRGGSDTTAVALASSLGATCEIYSDVLGVYGTDPRIYPETKKIDQLSFEEMMELSSLGAGILETRSVEIALNHNTPIYTGKTLSTKRGTWIMPTEQIIERKAVTGIALDKNMDYITLSYPMHDANVLKAIYYALEQQQINIDMISQTVNTDGMQLSFTMKNTEQQQIISIIEKLKQNYPALLHETTSHYAKVSVVGSGMRDMSGVAAKVFTTLIDAEIPYYQVSTSEISISVVVADYDAERAVQTLCQHFNI
ncbi:aspartate kinase [Macrococcoides caseolyticum]|uniref:aspartate kinase n=1 Tax=Macrococcoides caseolyticum TaxID=69966 RepID=UPI001F30F52F|nr:aspartate kinase [Macrococcus caseolyticus]MCE4956991.1 aspartate kinase [Macrococcus caseolyticus]